MASILLRVEASNLGASVYDTEDLSTIRGGGFANLLAPRAIVSALGQSGLGTLTTIYQGASQAVAAMEANAGVGLAEIERELEDLARGRKPLAADAGDVGQVLPHLTFMIAAVPATGDAQADDDRLIARARARQLQRPTLDLPPLPAPAPGRPCAFDGKRPAEAPLMVGTEKFEVSSSVRVRRAAGRKLRQTIYREITRNIAGDDAENFPNFADMFEDLVRAPPKGLPPSLRNKMAVVHIDGNGFGQIRRKAIEASSNRRDAMGCFSKELIARRARTLVNLVKFLEKDRSGMLVADEKGAEKLRFETLLWGGDEARFLLPAWKVRDLLDFLAEDFAAGYEALGRRLSHRCGILVCHYKMPIATATSLVEDIMEAGKPLVGPGDAGDVVSLQMVESIEPPSGTLGAFRRASYGTDAPAAFGWAGASTLDARLAPVDRITNPDTGLPKSQLYGLIAEARAKGHFPKPADSDKAVAFRDNRLGEILQRIDRQKLESDLLGLTLAEAPFVGLVRLAELWDLFQPFPGAR